MLEVMIGKDEVGVKGRVADGVGVSVNKMGVFVGVKGNGVSVGNTGGLGGGVLDGAITGGAFRVSCACKVKAAAV
jgi:hypothetical protein